MTRTESTRAIQMAARHGVEVTRHKFGNRYDWAVEFPMDRTTYDLPATKRHIALLSHGTLDREEEVREDRTRQATARGWSLVSEAKMLLGHRTWADYGVRVAADGLIEGVG